MIYFPGDVLLFESPKGFQPVDSAIRLIQGNKYIHCALVMQKGENPLVVEIDTSFKLRVVNLSVSTAGRTFVVAENTDIHVDEQELLLSALEIKGSSYAYEKIVDALINHLMGRLLGADYKFRPFISHNNETRFICSTCVSYLLSKAAGLPFDPDAEPDDYTKDGWEIVSSPHE